MAIMIPGEFYIDYNNYSPGEKTLFDKFKLLSDEYYIFHSTHWNEKRRASELSRKEYIQWGEADFTIFHPKFGIIVFEVKGGEILYQPYQGWIQKNRYTGFEKTVDPMNQAEKSKYHFLDRLKKCFHGNSPYTLCSAVWFPDADRTCVSGKMPDAYKEELVLWADQLASTANIEKALMRIYEFSAATIVEPSEVMTKKVLDIFAPEFGAFQSLRSRAITSKILFHKMTLEQSYLLDYLDEQSEAAIHGVAGTGKTVLAVQKAQRLAENGKVLFLCFNKFLKEHLEKVHTHESIDFYSLDSLLVKKTARPLPTGAREKDEAILEFLMDWKNESWDYRHIVIDEGQDFKSDHLQALHEIASAQEGCFYVFYDRNQFVQGLNFPEWLDQMECRLVLSRNCRNTKEIAITSTRSIALDMKKIRSRFELPSTTYQTPQKPVLFFTENVSDLKEKLLKLLTKYVNAGIKKENIVVLSCKSEGLSALQSADLQLNPHYRLSKERVANSILFTTVRKFKGLEAEAIICIDVDAATFASDKERNAFYVGTSRATTVLDLITLSTSEQLSAALTGNENLKGGRSIKAVRDYFSIKIGEDADLA